MSQVYNDPAGNFGAATDSSIGPQTRTDYYDKAALVEAAKESYFSQQASVTDMPKHMGKKIKKFHYLPILDDRNQNEQGLDAAGAAPSAGALSIAYISVLETGFAESQTIYFRGDSTTTDAEALLKAKANFNAWAYDQGYTVVQVNTATDYTALVALVEADGYDTVVVADATSLTTYGNLYGSSKDIGTIQGKIPALTENGGEVNRVGVKRILVEGTIEKFGIHEKYNKESMDFDSDSERLGHLTMEAVKAANETTEDQLQIDLINGAGVTRFAGAATSLATLNGDVTGTTAFDAGVNDTVTYDDLVKLGIELDNNRTPKKTNIIAGSRMVDTRVVNAARYIYIGSELQPAVMRMKDYHGNKAFIPVAQYAEAGNTAVGEFGAIDNFRFIVVPEMMHHQGAGEVVAAGSEETTSFRYASNSTGAALHYNAYPMLVIGDGSFTTIGFQTDGKTTKFKIKHVKPESDVSYALDKYGETGFYSIKWYYGTMVLRPERLAVMWSVAEW